MRALQLFSTCFEMIRTGFRPDTEEPFAWYDRAIRVMGAIMILATFAAGLILLAIEAFQK